MADDNKGAGLLCPACRVDLVMSERQGIEIDYCPKCRGVWLDRGELDKIIERSQAAEAQAAPSRAPQRDERRDDHDDDRRGWGHGGGHDGGRGGGHGGGHGGRGRRRSFLGELFD